MSTTAHGLVVGKFHPPHAGHDLLFRSAAAASDRLSILVLANPGEGIALQERLDWIRDMLADLPHVTIAGGIDPHPIDYDDPLVWDLHEAAFRAVLATVTDQPVTAVFSSEPYGDELARRFNCIHAPIDIGRMLVPISSTRVREDPVAAWEFLPPAVRGGLARRVVVLGAESTGTTTVARRLADRLRRIGGSHGLTRYVPEYGRDVSVEKLGAATARAAVAGLPRPDMDDLTWSTREFIQIAVTQNRMEDEQARIGGPVLVCDTDAFATGIWHERYRGDPSEEVDGLARHHPLYLLTHHDGVPFVQDGLRDGEGIRTWMTERFAEALERSGRRYVVLTGAPEERVEQAMDAIDDLVRSGWGFDARAGDAP